MLYFIYRSHHDLYIKEMILSMPMKKYIPMSEASCYILLSIIKEEKHGYAIMQHIKQMTNGDIAISNGTLYGVLNRMIIDNLIEVYSNDNKKIYKITDLGRDILMSEKRRLESLLENFKFIK